MKTRRQQLVIGAIGGLLAVTEVFARTPDPITISLKPEASVTSQQVYLRDVAQIDSKDSLLAERLGNVKLASAPRIGYAERLSREEIERAIRLRLSAGLHPQWEGARAVTVRTAGRVLEAARVIDQAQSYLASALRQQGEGWSISPATAIDDIEVPQGEVSLKPRPIDVDHLSSRVPVHIDVYVNQVLARSVVVPFTVRVKQNVYIAKRSLPEGSIVTVDDFEIRNDIVGASQRESAPVASLDGTVRLRKRIAGGQMLTAGQVSADGAVLRGDAVQLIVASNGIRIETRATAQQDGQLGQTIRVRMDGATEMTTARIVGPGVVQAEGG